MSFDLLIRNANLPDGRTGIDIASRDGRIVAIEKGISAEAGQTIDAGGKLVSPPFVDIHFHMDGTLSLGRPRLNRSGTLLEGIQLWGELRPTLERGEMVERALRYCDLAVSQGLLAVRSHVDVTDPRLTGVEALLEVKDRVKDYLDLQLVAFPQDGYFRAPGNVERLERALDMGVEVVGGIPHGERTMEDGRLSVIAQCAIAAKRGLMVDIHCDETDDPMSRHIETMVCETQRLGLGGRVAGSHLTSMHSMDNYYASKLLGLIAEAGVHCVPNPVANTVLQGRHDTYPKRRGMMRVPELMALGVNVAYGQDSMMDPWYPLGNADMLDVASMGAHVGHMTTFSAMPASFDAVTVNAAKVFGLADYGLEVGKNADFVLLEARDVVEAIRLRPARLAVVRRGKVIATSPSRASTLSLDGRPATVEPWRYAPTI